MLRIILFTIIICHTHLTPTSVAAKNHDEDKKRPYEFGFRIENNQHRYERRDENGIVMGQFGFVTGDGIYRATVYATDEKGTFKVVAMRNLPLSEITDVFNLFNVSAAAPSSKFEIVPLKASIPVSYNLIATSTPKSPIKLLEKPINTKTCSNCGLPTTKKPIYITSLPVVEKPVTKQFGVALPEKLTTYQQYDVTPKPIVETKSQHFIVDDNIQLKDPNQRNPAQKIFKFMTQTKFANGLPSQNLQLQPPQSISTTMDKLVSVVKDSIHKVSLKQLTVKTTSSPIQNTPLSFQALEKTNTLDEPPRKYESPNPVSELSQAIPVPLVESYLERQPQIYNKPVFDTDIRLLDPLGTVKESLPVGSINELVEENYKSRLTLPKIELHNPLSPVRASVQNNPQVEHKIANNQPLTQTQRDILSGPVRSELFQLTVEVVKQPTPYIKTTTLPEIKTGKTVNQAKVFTEKFKPQIINDDTQIRVVDPFGAVKETLPLVSINKPVKDNSMYKNRPTLTKIELDNPVSPESGSVQNNPQLPHNIANNELLTKIQRDILTGITRVEPLQGEVVIQPTPNIKTTTVPEIKKNKTDNQTIASIGTLKPSKVNVDVGSVQSIQPQLLQRVSAPQTPEFNPGFTSTKVNSKVPLIDREPDHKFSHKPFGSIEQTFKPQSLQNKPDLKLPEAQIVEPPNDGIEIIQSQLPMDETPFQITYVKESELPNRSKGSLQIAQPLQSSLEILFPVNKESPILTEIKYNEKMSEVSGAVHNLEPHNPIKLLYNVAVISTPPSVQIEHGGLSNPVRESKQSSNPLQSTPIELAVVNFRQPLKPLLTDYDDSAILAKGFTKMVQPQLHEQIPGDQPAIYRTTTLSVLQDMQNKMDVKNKPEIKIPSTLVQLQKYEVATPLKELKQKLQGELVNPPLISDHVTVDAVRGSIQSVRLQLNEEKEHQQSAVDRSPTHSDRLRPNLGTIEIVKPYQNITVTRTPSLSAQIKYEGLSSPVRNSVPSLQPLHNTSVKLPAVYARERELFNPIVNYYDSASPIRGYVHTSQKNKPEQQSSVYRTVTSLTQTQPHVLLDPISGSIELSKQLQRIQEELILVNREPANKKEEEINYGRENPIREHIQEIKTQLNSNEQTSSLPTQDQLSTSPIRAGLQINLAEKPVGQAEKTIPKDTHNNYNKHTNFEGQRVSPYPTITTATFQPQTIILSRFENNVENLPRVHFQPKPQSTLKPAPLNIKKISIKQPETTRHNNFEIQPLTYGPNLFDSKKRINLPKALNTSLSQTDTFLSKHIVPQLPVPLLYKLKARMPKIQKSPVQSSLPRQTVTNVEKEVDIQRMKKIGSILYQFNYTTGYHGHHEQGDYDGNKDGGYYLIGRDGYRWFVDYKANEDGYQPKVHIEYAPPQDAQRVETEKENGLEGYEFKWFYVR